MNVKERTKEKDLYEDWEKTRTNDSRKKSREARSDSGEFGMKINYVIDFCCSSSKFSFSQIKFE